MANRNDNQQQQQPVRNTNQNKTRKGDTSRTSDSGRKAASGGSPNTNNRGQRRGGREVRSETGEVRSEK